MSENIFHAFMGVGRSEQSEEYTHFYRKGESIFIQPALTNTACLSIRHAFFQEKAYMLQTKTSR